MKKTILPSYLKQYDDEKNKPFVILLISNLLLEGNIFMSNNGMMGNIPLEVNIT
jgi:hypothetical protein